MKTLTAAEYDFLELCGHGRVKESRPFTLAEERINGDLFARGLIEGCICGYQNFSSHAVLTELGVTAKGYFEIIRRLENWQP